MSVKSLLAGLSVALLSLQAAAGAQAPGSYRQQLGSGQIHWTEQYIEVRGSGIAPTQGSPAQQKLMARRAATADAYRNLLEVVNGVRVSAETTVRDFVTESDVVRTRVEGVVKGAVPVGEPQLKDGAVEVVLRVPLYQQLASAIELDKVVARQQQSGLRSEQRPDQPRMTEFLPEFLPAPLRLASLDLSGLSFELARCQRVEQPQPGDEETTEETTEETVEQPEYVPVEETVEEPINEPIEEPVSEPISGESGLQAPDLDQAFSGLIVDARGMGLSPSMSPRVSSETSQVYVGNFELDIDRVIAEGIVLYYSSLDEALASPRIGKHPLVVRPVGTDKHRVDFVISTQDAAQIQAFDQRDRFLQKLQVVAVLD